MYRGTEPDIAAVQRLFSFFHLESCTFPSNVRGFEKIAGYLNERTDLILSPVTLDQDWYRAAAGAVLAKTGEGVPCVILPDWLGRYYFIDEGTRQRVYLSAENSGQFQRGAYSVALAISGETVSLPSLVRGLFRGIGAFEWGVLSLWCVMGGCLIVVLSNIIGRAVRNAIRIADSAQLGTMTLELMFVLLLGTLTAISGEQILRRAAQKAALAILPGLGERAYFTREPNVSVGCLADLRENAQRLTDWILHALCAGVVVLMPAWSLGQTSAVVLGAGLLIALLLFAAALAVCWGCAQAAGGGRPEEELRQWLLYKGTDKRFGIHRPFPAQKNGVPWESIQMFFVLAVLLTTLPLVFFSIGKGYSAMRFFQLLALYLPMSALPLRVLFQAPQAGQAMARIRPLLSARYLSSGEVDLPPMGSVLELKDVSFSYPDKIGPVLRGVNLRLHPGETVGILGATGAGKSTLAQLMTGDLKPTGGNVYYGGVEIARYNFESVLRRIAYGAGEDICLSDSPLMRRDGRTCVIFSTRESNLTSCDRILRLVDGRLVQ